MAAMKHLKVFEYFPHHCNLNPPTSLGGTCDNIVQMTNPWRTAKKDFNFFFLFLAGDLISLGEIIAIKKSCQMGLRRFSKMKKKTFLGDEETKNFETETGRPSAV